MSVFLLMDAARSEIIPSLSIVEDTKNFIATLMPCFRKGSALDEPTQKCDTVDIKYICNGGRWP